MVMPGKGKGGNGRLKPKCIPPACEAVATPTNIADNKSNFFIYR
jgi:hypothetical protein